MIAKWFGKKLILLFLSFTDSYYNKEGTKGGDPSSHPL